MFQELDYYDNLTLWFADAAIPSWLKKQCISYLDIFISCKDVAFVIHLTWVECTMKYHWEDRLSIACENHRQNCNSAVEYGN